MQKGDDKYSSLFSSQRLSSPHLKGVGDERPWEQGCVQC